MPTLLDLGLVLCLLIATGIVLYVGVIRSGLLKEFDEDE